jgi:hypothetical protein
LVEVPISPVTYPPTLPAGRSVEGATPDQADARPSLNEEGLCDDQGLRGDGMFNKGQFRLWIEAVGGGTESSFINRLFGVYA